MDDVAGQGRGELWILSPHEYHYSLLFLVLKQVRFLVSIHLGIFIIL